MIVTRIIIGVSYSLVIGGKSSKRRKHNRDRRQGCGVTQSLPNRRVRVEPVQRSNGGGQACHLFLATVYGGFRK